MTDMTDAELDYLKDQIIKVKTRLNRNLSAEQCRKAEGLLAILTNLARGTPLWPQMYPGLPAQEKTHDWKSEGF